MSGRKVKVSFQGREVDAVTVDAAQTNERWNEYLLDDGTLLKVKLVLTNVTRLDNCYTQQGEPVYAIQSTTVVSTNAPQELRKRPPEKHQ